MLIVMMFSIFRPGVIQRVVRGQGSMAKSAKALIILVYPVVVLAILFISVLYSLNYDEAALTYTVASLTTAGVLLASWYLYRTILRAARPGKDFERVVQPEDFDDHEKFLEEGRDLCFDRLIRLFLRVGFFLPALMISRSFWPSFTWEFLGQGLLSGSGISVGEILGAVLAFWITFVLLGHYRATMRFVVMPGTRIDRGIQYTITTLSSYGVLAVGLIVALQILRVDGSQIGFVISALAVGIGFGLKTIIQNLVSGIILLVERPVKVGDWVEIGDKSGKVQKITIRATTVMTWDGVGVVIPNEDLVGGQLVNASLGQPRLRRVVNVGVAYGSDVQQVKKLILEATTSHGLVLKRPPPEVFFIGFGDSSLDFMVRFWTSMSSNGMRVKSDIRIAIESTFSRHEIEIPFPQRDLNVRNVDARVVAEMTGRSLPAPDPVPDRSPGDSDTDSEPVKQMTENKIGSKGGK